MAKRGVRFHFEVPVLSGRLPMQEARCAFMDAGGVDRRV